MNLLAADPAEHLHATGASAPPATALVVHDDAQMISVIEFALETRGFAVAVARTGIAAVAAARSQPPDLVVLDVTIPLTRGGDLLHRLRTACAAPLLVLTDATPDDRLDTARIEYLSKPFHPRDLALRAHARTRPARPERRDEILHVGRMRIDPGRLLVTIGGRRLDLSYTEFRLLAHLARHRGHPQSWRTLLGVVWGANDLVGGRDVVKSAVYRLRLRLASADDTDHIVTLRGAGYLMPDLPPCPN